MVLLLKTRWVSGTPPETAGWLPGADSDAPKATVSVRLVVERLVMPTLMTACVRPKASPAELATSYSTGAVKFPTVATLNQ